MKRLLILTALLLSCVSPLPNNCPDPPVITGGTSTALPDSICIFHVRATDPDGDSISIRTSWGNGDTTDWSALIASGQSVQVSHSWPDTGHVDVRVQSSDKACLESDWSEPWPVDIVRYPFPWRIVETIALPTADFLYGLTVTPDGRYVYAPDYEGDTVYVIRTSDNAVAARIPMHTGRDCWGRTAAALPGGDYVYCTGYGECGIGVMRTSNHTVVDSIRVSTEVLDIVASSDGKHVFTGSSWNGRYDSCFIWKVRTSDNAVVDSVLVDTEGGAFTCLEISPDGNLLYAVISDDRNILVYRTSDLTLVDSIYAKPCVEPPAMAISPDGAYLYFGGYSSEGVAVFRTSDGACVGLLETGWYPFGVAAGHDGQYVHVASQNIEDATGLLTTWRTAGWTRVRSLAFPEWNSCSLVPTPDGERLYVARSDGIVYVFSR
jgi:YVTN family beta-propeller protein